MQRSLLTFAVIAGVIIIFFFRISKSDREVRDAFQRFIDEEREANFSRRKDPAPEEFLRLGGSILPIREYPGDHKYNRVARRQREAQELAGQPMLPVGKLTNRELKLKYGAANLDMIISYDENYNRFIHGLLEWAAALISISSFEDAEKVLGVAVDCGCDRSQAYTMLADIFCLEPGPERLRGLYDRVAESEALQGTAKAKALEYISDKITSAVREDQ